MPGMYQEGEYDLAGFAVGVVEKKRLIDGRSIQAGDRVIGLASHGLHSNGFSLVRKVLLDDRTYDWSERVPSSEQTLAEALLQPTRIYVKTFLSIMEAFTIKGAAHITGGGLIENVPRVLPKGLKAVIDPTRWPVPAIFRWIQTEGILTQWDMYRTFNMGIGMVLIVSEEESENVLAYAQELGEKAYLIGIIEEGQEGVVLEKESVS
jgi:phosphoribosylformylglycinamidine cyclo-ligase